MDCSPSYNVDYPGVGGTTTSITRITLHHATLKIFMNCVVFVFKEYLYYMYVVVVVVVVDYKKLLRRSLLCRTSPGFYCLVLALVGTVLSCVVLCCPVLFCAVPNCMMAVVYGDKFVGAGGGGGRRRILLFHAVTPVMGPSVTAP